MDRLILQLKVHLFILYLVKDSKMLKLVMPKLSTNSFTVVIRWILVCWTGIIGSGEVWQHISAPA